MKITNKRLKQIIKEELEAVMEGDENYRAGLNARQALPPEAGAMSQTPIQDSDDFTQLLDALKSKTARLKYIEDGVEMGDPEATGDAAAQARQEVQAAQKQLTDFIQGYIRADQTVDSWEQTDV